MRLDANFDDNRETFLIRNDSGQEREVRVRPHSFNPELVVVDIFTTDGQGKALKEIGSTPLKVHEFQALRGMLTAL